MAGLSPDTLRLPGQEEAEPPEPQDVDVGDTTGPVETLDEQGNVLSIEYEDGTIEISMDGSPLKTANDDQPVGWFSNLCDKIGDMELGRISESLLRGIMDDEASRKEWVEDGASAIRLLGFKLNVPGVGGSVEGAPVEGMSTVRHPLLGQAVLNFQANARSEMLPTDGPAKIRDDNNNPTTEEDALADAFETDINHYLTVTAKEYYPDTDRMLIPLALRGTSFKKVYFCPLRNRPVSETVDADDLIVNNSATDLRNAKRVTHRIEMPPNTVKRMQILGVYREVSLGTPQPIDLDAVQREKKDQQGIQDSNFNPDDRDREIYECYCELNIKGFEHKIKGKETGLEIPYRATIDKTSRQILALVRDYNQDTNDLPERRTTFVKYTFIPGFGFYDIGFLHILGNTTNALTAAWREMLDAGMFACFPGFLLADTGGRQNTNIFRIPPGGGQLVKTGGMPINQAVMPLPYKEPSAALMQFTQNMAETGQRLAGVADLQVGEGQQNMPVGTMLAIIEQATKVENAIHKRMHASQAEELQLLVECFREHPESFWQRNRKPALPWDQETFERALDTFDLVPQADPNTSSHTQRIMKAVALKQLQQLSPQLYDPKQVDSVIIRILGFGNAEQFFAPATGQPTPEQQKAMADANAKGKTADARMLDAETKAKEVALKANQGLSGGKTPQELALAKQSNDLKGQAQQFEQQRAGIEDQNRDQDREADLTIAQMRLAGDLLHQEKDQQHDHAILDKEHVHDTVNGGLSGNLAQ